MLVASGAAGALRAQAPQPALAAALGGRWTPDAGGGCAQVFQFQLTGNTLRLTGPDGHVDVQRVLQRREAGIATATTASTHGIPAGTKWVYEVLAPGQLSVTDGSGRSANFQHCHDPIPPTATPSAFLHGLFDLYVADADASLPFASEAGLRAFLVPDLADQITRYFARLNQGGHIDTVCLRSEPITGAEDDYKVTDVTVIMADADPATPDRAAGSVSFKNMGEPSSVAFDLRRTAAGWRIDDLRAGSNPSLRHLMAPCAAEAR